ncbi:cell division protein ZipA [Aliiglaciecola sp. 3_MG-2023]|uniref:cell division protein ZipA n=1 Tax=Aliiglaciecola sp. 3_MG-2023 TaxID=3062644 RepID=UPI0026E30EF7|nr:cell division protein ZipA [Aliiglaciecola sp. 3_MG-2023]MDO6693595.1 cell division protein ZipA [Aliiglaciecola sp. 3_MG-2023]
MEELRLAFLVIGGVAIIGILAHGMWSVRKNAQEKGHANLETQGWDDEYDEDIEDIDTDSEPSASSDVIEMGAAAKSNDKVEPSLGGDNFDELGIGAVRVVSQASNQQNAADPETPLSTKNAQGETNDIPETNLSENAGDVIKQDVTEQAVDSQAVKPKIYSSVVTQPKPEYAAQQVHAMRSRMSAIDNADPSDIPEPPPFLLRTNELETGKAPGGQPAIESGEQPNVTDSVMDFSAVDEVAANPDVTAKPKSPDSPNIKPDTEHKSEPKVEPEPKAETPVDNKVSLADQARNFVKRSKAEPKPRKRKEPQIREDQMKIDFDEPEATSDASATQKSAQSPSSGASSENTEPPEQQVLVLNVRANDDNPIQGAALLPMLLTLGFKFGDQDIFHRHVNSNGKGPVLFSLANMFKPGVFDIDNLENFTTLGVSLFMMLPIEGDPHQVFNMMHNAARKIADEFSAQVLDGRRSALTKQSLQQYVEKIREFERKRMIAR